MPGGGPGADEGEMLRNAQLHLASFWGHFWRKIVIFEGVFLGRFLDEFFIEFWWFWEYF